MPWKETSAMDQRIQLIAEWMRGAYTKSELCRAYGISRPTANKWIARYTARGAPGLEEGSRAPHTHPNETPEPVRAMIVATKLRHQRWGPKKVMDRLRRERPDVPWPADSTAGALLQRAGLVRPRTRRRRVAPDSAPFRQCDGPNQSWSADFKGDCRLGNGQRCYPLTMSDNFSRYLLVCRGLERPSYEAVRPWCEWVFREYGLPEALRTDNGAPFASLAVGGLSRLSKWWIQLGIKPERIRPGRPAQNGRHERMHRTLKEAVPVRTTLSAQQRRYDAFCEEYNWHRSHEALGRKTPGEVYSASPRPYPGILPPVEYESGVTVRQVRHNGEIKWRGALIYVSEVLAHEPLGLTPIDEDTWAVRYSFHVLGVLNQRLKKILPATGWHGIERVNV